MLLKRKQIHWEQPEAVNRDEVHTRSAQVFHIVLNETYTTFMKLKEIP